MEALAEPAATHIEAERFAEAIHLLEIATAGDPRNRKAHETRKAALEGLLREAEPTFQSRYEMDFLKYRSRPTDEPLGAGAE